MLSFISNCKQTIIKYKKQLLTFALIPVFMFRSSLSGFARTKVEIEDSWIIDWYSSGLPSATIYNSSGIGIYGPSSVGDLNATNEYSVSNSALTDVSTIRINSSDKPMYYQYLPEVYDLWISITCNSYDTSNPSDFTFVPSNIQLIANICTESGDHNGYSYFDCDSESVFHYDDRDQIGFTIVGKFPSNLSSTACTGFQVLGSSGKVPKNLRFTLLFYAVPKSSSSSEDSTAIVSAIQSQTQTFLNAGSNNIKFATQLHGLNSNLSGFIDDYTEVEHSMYNQFIENQSSVIGNFSGFSWGSLSTAVDWTSDYLNQIYDNSGDFRTMFMYPILAGIALIFIGRQGLTAYVRSRRDK